MNSGGIWSCPDVDRELLYIVRVGPRAAAGGGHGHLLHPRKQTDKRQQTTSAEQQTEQR